MASKLSARYKDVLKALSARTGTSLPSLTVSFAILHELTAVASLVGIFYGARALGLGERWVDAARPETSSPDLSGTLNGWMKGQWNVWVDEGGKWAERVGRRYGMFGFEKGSRPGGPEADTRVRSEMSSRIAGDVANAIVAYGLTKALVPIRIPLSIYLSPMFSRRVLDPVRYNIIRPFRRNPPPSP